jgi:hypothetical protein
MQAIESTWAAFVQAYRKKYPQHSLTEKDLSLRGAAKNAGIEGYYDGHYRLYHRSGYLTVSSGTPVTNSMSH